MFEKDDSTTTLLDFETSDLEARRANSRTFFLPPSGMNFLDDHFGPRPGCLHTLLGSTGRGKSTLIQSLLLAWGKNSTMLVYLSEEAIDRIETKIFEKDPQAQYLTPRLHLVHEQDMIKSLGPTNIYGFLRVLDIKLKASQAKILIIDNLTTSAFYESKFSNVLPLLAGLREIATRNQVAIFCVCHTKKGVNEQTKGLILPDDVRGSASLGLTSDYFYTFYRVRHTNDFGITRDSAFIYVCKSRDHDNQDHVYRLEYDVERKLYVKDHQVRFDVFKDLMKKRDRI